MCSQAGVAGAGIRRVAFYDNDRFADRFRLGVNWSRCFWVDVATVLLMFTVALISLPRRKGTVATIARMMGTATRHRKGTILAVSWFVHTTSRNKLAQHSCVFRTDIRKRRLFWYIGRLLLRLFLGLILLGWFVTMVASSADGSISRRGGSQLGYRWTVTVPCVEMLGAEEPLEAIFVTLALEASELINHVRKTREE